MMPHQTAEEVHLSEAQRYLAELQGAQSDAEFIEAFSMLWLHLRQCEPPVPMSAVPINEALLGHLLEEFGRRASALIAGGDPRAARTIWAVTHDSQGADSPEIWQRAGVSFDWYIAEIHRMIRAFHTELMNGRFDRAPDLVFLPPYHEHVPEEVLDPRYRTDIAQGFVRWVVAEYQSLSHSTAESTVVIQQAVFVWGLAEAARSHLTHHANPAPDYLLPYRQLDPLIEGLSKLVGSYFGR